MTLEDALADYGITARPAIEGRRFLMMGPTSMGLFTDDEAWLLVRTLCDAWDGGFKSG